MKPHRINKMNQKKKLLNTTNVKQQRNHKCNFCGKYFTQSDYLKIHIRTIHEEQRNFKCDSCGKFFTQSGALKEHIKTVQDKEITNVILVENSSLNQEI